MGVIPELQAVTKITHHEKDFNRDIAASFNTKQQKTLYSFMRKILADELAFVISAEKRRIEMQGK